MTVHGEDRAQGSLNSVCGYLGDKGQVIHKKIKISLESARMDLGHTNVGHIGDELTRQQFNRKPLASAIHACMPGIRHSFCKRWTRGQISEALISVLRTRYIVIIPNPP